MAISKLKALELRNRNPERSAAAPPALQQQVPIIPPELSGQLAEPPSVATSEYQLTIFDEDNNPTSSSAQHTLENQSPAAILDVSHGPDIGMSSQPGPSSNKRKESASLNSEQAAKKP